MNVTRMFAVTMAFTRVARQSAAAQQTAKLAKPRWLLVPMAAMERFLLFETSSAQAQRLVTSLPRSVSAVYTCGRHAGESSA